MIVPPLPPSRQNRPTSGPASARAKRAQMRQIIEHATPLQTVRFEAATVVRQSPTDVKHVRLAFDASGVEDGADYPVYTGLTSTVVGATGGPAIAADVLVLWLDGQGILLALRNY